MALLADRSSGARAPGGLWWLLAPACLASTVAAQEPVPPADDPMSLEAGPVDGGDSTKQIESADFVTRFEAELAYRDLLDQRRYAEALPVGERLLALTRAEFGEESLEVATALTSLGEMQRRAGEHAQSEQSLLQALDIVRAVEGPFSERLITPMLGLGSNYHDDEQYLNALTVFSEARAINRRVLGLLNDEQISILDRLTETLFSMERYEEAHDQQFEALQIAERRYGPESPEVLDAVYKYARWLRRNGRYQEERQNYARAIAIIREHYGSDSVEMTRPLRETGNSFRIQRIGEGQGASSLKRALEILEAEADSDPLIMAQVLRDMGDWQVAFSKVGSDGAEYRRAWQLLGRVEDGDALREAWFTGPEYVFREPVSQRGLSDDPNAAAGYVLIQFDLDELGRTENVTVLESQPPGVKDDSVVRAIRRSRFRPQMADGEIIRGERLALQFTYRYMPDDDEQQP